MSILDYGGALGNTYVSLLRGVNSSSIGKYTVKELDAVCAAGKEEFSDDKRIDFVTEIPDGPHDIVYLGSTIQYESDWKSVLAEIAEAASRYVLITDLPAGENPTYASAQKYYTSSIPCWFFNLDEFVQVSEAEGLSLLSSSEFYSNILSRYNYYPQSNFPLAYRVGRAKTILLAKSSGNTP